MKHIVLKIILLYVIMLTFTTYNTLNKLEKLLTIHNQKKKLKCKIILMIKHINDKIYDSELRHKKIWKVDRLMNHLMVLKEGYYSLNLQYIALTWLNARWNKIVLENGFISIPDMVNNIRLPSVLDWNLLSNDRISIV